MHILLELVDSLERHIGYNTVREFEVNYPLSKSADIKKKISMGEYNLQLS